jgi:hypothetical protein
MNSETQSPQTEVQKGVQGTAAIAAIPTPFNASAMSDVMVKAYDNVVKASAKAQPLQKAYIARMQMAAGYEMVPDLKKEDQGAAATALKMIHDGELTAKGITRATDAGLIRLVETKPDQALVDAIAKFDGALKELQTTVIQAVRPLMVAVPTKKGNVNVPAGERKRKPSKGFISAEEWASISDAEKVQYSMTYDEIGITLSDVNGDEHYCKAIGALQRHEQGEGHKSKA